MFLEGRHFSPDTPRPSVIEKPKHIDIMHPAIRGGEKTAFIFVGQGMQEVGMGGKIYENYTSAREVYDTADEVVAHSGYSVRDISFNGPEDTLKLTRYAQPAIVTYNYAYYRVLREVLGSNFVKPGALAGFSLGEITALAVSGAVDFETMLELVDTRALLMQRECEKNPGGIVMIRLKQPRNGLPTREQQVLFARAIQHMKNKLHVAYIRGPFDFGIGGAEDELIKQEEWLERYKKETKAEIQFMRSPVTGAFHTLDMKQASEDLDKKLGLISIQDAEIPVIANTTGKKIQTPDDIRREVVDHISKPVRWYKSIRVLRKYGIKYIVEFGERPIISRLHEDADYVTVPVATDKHITIAHVSMPRQELLAA